MNLNLGLRKKQMQANQNPSPLLLANKRTASCDSSPPLICCNDNCAAQHCTSTTLLNYHTPHFHLYAYQLCYYFLVISIMEIRLFCLSTSSPVYLHLQSLKLYSRNFIISLHDLAGKSLPRKLCSHK